MKHISIYSNADWKFMDECKKNRNLIQNLNEWFEEKNYAFEFMNGDKHENNSMSKRCPKHAHIWPDVYLWIVVEWMIWFISYVILRANRVNMNAIMAIIATQECSLFSIKKAIIIKFIDTKIWMAKAGQSDNIPSIWFSQLNFVHREFTRISFLWPWTTSKI